MSDKQSITGLNGGGYGIRSIQKLRHGLANSVNINKQPTAELVAKLDDTYEYFLKEVDPLIGRCITHLLCKQPGDIAMGMLDFFDNEQILLSGDDISEETPEDEDDSMYAKKKPKKEQKMYLAMSVGPAITKLVNRIALRRPKKVLDYCCVELQTMIYGSTNDEADGKYNSYDDDGLSFAELRIIQRKEDIKNGIIPDKELVVPDKDRPNTPKKSSSSSSSPAKPPSPIKQPLPSNQEVIELPIKEPSVNIQLAILGKDGAGKSSILNMLQGKNDPKIKPTIGFRPVSLMLGDDVKVRFYDLGGGKKIRDIWDQYYYDVHGVIYVIDASSSDEDIKETKELLHTTMNHKYLAGKPLLLISNKQDKEGAKSTEESKQLMELTNINGDHNTEVFGCSTISTVTDPEDGIFPADPRLESAIEWILTNVQSSYESLNKRVQLDTQMKLEDEAKKRMEKERKVLRNKIACAFPHLVSKSPIGDLILPDAPEDVFTMEEGLAFLAGEIGEDTEALPPIALEIAALIGYQRLALQLVGALKAPISKKKAPLSWDEIKALIVELREELGLGLSN